MHELYALKEKIENLPAMFLYDKALKDVGKNVQSSYNPGHSPGNPHGIGADKGEKMYDKKFDITQDDVSKISDAPSTVPDKK